MPRSLIAAGIVLVYAASAHAGGIGATRIAQSEAPVRSSTQTPNMADVAIGDHWTYNFKDEITGVVTATRKFIVTDVANGQVATRFDVAQTGRTGTVLFDKSWNVLREGGSRYSPNSGTGVQLPLSVNSQWKTSADEIMENNGNAWKISVSSRVTGQETVTTKAGTFPTFVIETTQIFRNAKSPTKKWETSTHTWFNPEINHWVKRNVVRREDGLVVGNNTLELVEYGRKATQ